MFLPPHFSSSQNDPIKWWIWSWHSSAQKLPVAPIALKQISKVFPVATYAVCSAVLLPFHFISYRVLLLPTLQPGWLPGSGCSQLRALVLPTCFTYSVHTGYHLSERLSLTRLVSNIPSSCHFGCPHPSLSVGLITTYRYEFSGWFLHFLFPSIKLQPSGAGPFSHSLLHS